MTGRTPATLGSNTLAHAKRSQNLTALAGTSCATRETRQQLTFSRGVHSRARSAGMVSIHTLHILHGNKRPAQLVVGRACCGCKTSLSAATLEPASLWAASTDSMPLPKRCLLAVALLPWSLALRLPPAGPCHLGALNPNPNTAPGSSPPSCWALPPRRPKP
jgi:hypothetical protein